MADELWPGIRRVRAANASPLTAEGTNTWIVGTGAVAVIDPGPADAAHLGAVLAAVGGARVEAILVTHAHLDHSALAPAMARATGAPVIAFGRADEGRSPAMARLVANGFPDGSEGVDRGFVPDLRLADGAVWQGAAGPVRALHTPGHMGNHLCFLWEDVAFSGDHVMGWATSVVSPPDGDIGDYMASLARLMAARPVRLMPGHGPVVADPAARIAALQAHRRARETAILAALEAGPARVEAIVGLVYADLSPALRAAAGRNVLAHLIDMHAKNRVTTNGGPGPSALWRLA